jgi:hypothetical protein
VPDLRGALFAVLVVGLTGAFLWVLSGGHQGQPSEPIAFAGAQVPRPLAPVPVAARRAARHFLAAFLSDEVGSGGLAARAAIRAYSVGALARELLADPPRAFTDAARARLGALRLHRLPGRPGLLLISGTARRTAGPEPFAFLFARRGGRWLALAPAE